MGRPRYGVAVVDARDALLVFTALAFTCVTGCAAGGTSADSSSPPVSAQAVAGSLGSLTSGPSSTPATRPSPAPSARPTGAAGSGSVPTTADASGSRGSAAVPQRTRPATPSSPTLFLHTDGTLGGDPSPTGRVALNSAGGSTRDGEPYRPLVFTASDLWLVPTGGATAFLLEVDAGRKVGAAVQARVSYDLTGDGSWDRVETYRYFAADPKIGTERYTQAVGLRNSRGSLGELRGGVVRLEVWSALGVGGTVIAVPRSNLSLPYR